MSETRRIGDARSGTCARARARPLYRVRSLALGALLLASGSLAGAEVRVEGLRLRLPEGWERAAGDGAALPAGEREEPLRGPWVAPDRSANVSVTVRPGYTEIGRPRLRSARREVEDALRRLAGPGGEVRTLASFECAEVGGAPAFRAECTLEREGVRVVQIQYILSARNTYVVTFTGAGPDPVELSEEAERVARAIRLEEKPDLAETAPPGACCACLVALAALSAAARRFLGR